MNYSRTEIEREREHLWSNLSTLTIPSAGNLNESLLDFREGSPSSSSSNFCFFSQTRSSFTFFLSQIFLSFLSAVRNLLLFFVSSKKKNVEIDGFESRVISNPAIDTPSIATHTNPLSFLPSNPWLRYNDLSFHVNLVRSDVFRGWSGGNWVGLGCIFRMEWNETWWGSIDSLLLSFRQMEIASFEEIFETFT